MKTNWQTKKLGEICNIEIGKTPSRSNKKLWDPEKGTGNIWLSIRDLSDTQQKIVTDSREYISDKGVEVSKIVKSGTLLVSFKLTIGRLAFAGRDLYTNEAIAALNIKNEQEISKEYLYQYLTYFDWDKATKNDVKVKGRTLNKAKLKEIEISYPSLIEQKKIVKTLNETFEKIEEVKANTEQNLRDSTGLIESYLYDVFSNTKKDWKQKTLKDISIEFGRGKSKHRPRNDKKLYDGSYPFIQTGDIRNSDHFITKYTQTYNDIGLAQSKLWPKGTICITIAANIAETGILSFAACFPDSIIGLVVDPKIAEQGFVEYLLQFFKTRIQAKGKGSAQANINLATFESETFPIPSVSEQKSIVKKLDALSEQVRKLELIYQKKLFSLKDLKKSILRQAFEGNLVAQEQPSSLPIPSPYIRNQVHAAIVGQVSKDGGETTEVAVAKYDHLLQEIFGVSLGYQFQTHLFGPFDATIKKLVSSGLSPRNKWFTKRNGMIVAGSNITALLSRSSNLYRSAQSAMGELARLGITKMNTDKVELLSTVCHAIKETHSTDVQQIRNFMSQWQTNNNQTKAQKFSLDETIKCVAFIIKNGLDKKIA